MFSRRSFTKVETIEFHVYQVVSVLARKGRCERASIDEVYIDLTEAAEAMLKEASPENLDDIHEEVLKSHVLGLHVEVKNYA